MPASRTCAWCPRELRPDARSDTRFCSRRCRQAAFRLRRRSGVAVARRGRAQRRVARTGVDDTPARFAYADPPYVGRAQRWYRDEEIDHEALIASLEASRYAGWALSAAADSLAEITPLCPPHRVCAWVKPIGASTRSFGLHNCWEALIVVGGRQRRPGVRDWLLAQPARGGGELPGRKPLAFCAWLFDCLGCSRATSSSTSSRGPAW